MSCLTSAPSHSDIPWTSVPLCVLRSSRPLYLLSLLLHLKSSSCSLSHINVIHRIFLSLQELLWICAAAPFPLISTAPPRFQVAGGALESPFSTNQCWKCHTWHKGSSRHFFLFPSSPPCPPLTCHQFSGASRYFWTQIVSWFWSSTFYPYIHAFIYFLLFPLFNSTMQNSKTNKSVKSA